MPDNTFMGVDRDKIDWCPRIDYSKCNYCLECDKFCPHNVFGRHDDEKKLVVKNPLNCVVFCKSCSKTCAADALSFPDKKETLEKIKKIRSEKK